jgi:hypothetical protein
MDLNLVMFRFPFRLSKLIPSKRNPRRVKPQREAHRQMVASIRAHGLLAPLVVRADDGTAGDFKVIAGNRRLAALREVYKDSAKPPKVRPTGRQQHQRWLSSYQKIPLAHLFGELHGPRHAKATEMMKKSDIVIALAKLFTGAAEGRLEERLAAKVNAWLPSNLAETAQPDETE